MSKNLSPTLLMLCSGVASLTLLLATNPAFAKTNTGNGNSSAQNQNKTQTPTTTTTPTPTQTQTVVAPTQSATPETSGFTIGLADLGKIFRINFGGNVDRNNIGGLTSFVDLTFKGFTTQNGSTIAAFDALLDNTSSGDILSRVSAFGFNTSATVLSANTSGLFDKAHLNDALPNGFGSIGVCFNAANGCQGGGNGGVNNSTSLPGTFDSGKFSFALALSGNVNTLSLNNFGVRYQSIDSKSLGLSGASGTGRGTYGGVVTPPVTNPPITTNPPVTNPPTNNLPTNPPVTNPPTNPPVTNPPTNPPVTNPPTNPPVTNPPTNPPTITNPPTTNPPLFNIPIDGTKPNNPTPPTPPSEPTPPPRVNTPKPAKVPEPSTIAALTLVGAIALKYRKKREVESEI